MKKKLLIFGLSSFLVLGTASIALLLTNRDNLFKAKSTGDYWTLSFDGEDVVGELVSQGSTSYKSGESIVKTDQNKNNVVLQYASCNAYNFNDTKYLNVAENGSLANISEIRGMVSLSVQQFGTFRVEWGFEEEAGVIQYVDSVEIYQGNNTYDYDFGGSNPNYFRITNLDAQARQLTNFVISMDKSCTHTESPYVIQGGVKYTKHGTYAECLGFAGASAATLNIANEIGGLPVTQIADSAFQGDKTITSLTLPDTLQVIRPNAFADCSNIGAIAIPKSVRTIGGSAFEGTSGCSALTFESGGTQDLQFGIAVFKGCGHAGTLTLPSRVSSLSYDGYTFASCMNITAFALNDDNHASNILSVEDGVLFANRENYNYNKKVLVSYPAANTRTEYTIPSDVTRIDTRDGLGFSFNIKKLIIDNDVDMMFGANACQSMVSLEEIEFKESTHKVHFYWYTFDYCPKLKKLLVPENLVIDNSGFARVSLSTSQPLHIYLPGNAVPESWHSDWDDGDVAAGKMMVFAHSELEPATDEAKLTSWHSVADVPTPWLLKIYFYCYRTDIGEGSAFYVLGSFNSWTPSEACRGTFANNTWTVAINLEPNVAYTFKGAIAAWDNPTDPVYEVGSNRSWAPDALSHEYTVDWHY